MLAWRPTSAAPVLCAPAAHLTGRAAPASPVFNMDFQYAENNAEDPAYAETLGNPGVPDPPRKPNPPR